MRGFPQFTMARTSWAVSVSKAIAICAAQTAWPLRSMESEPSPEWLRVLPVIYPYRDRECRQCGRQEPGPVVEKAHGDGRHETAHQETGEQTQRLSQMIGVVVVQCAAAF